MKYIKIITCLFLLSINILAQNAIASEDFLLAMQKKYKSIDSFTADFTQELFHRESQHSQTKAGNFTFKKDMNINFNVKSPNPELLIANKKEVWNYFPDEEIAYKYNPSIVQSSNNILSVMTGQATLDDEFEVEEGKEVELNGNIVKCFAIYPFEPSMDLVEAKIFVNKESKLIEAIQVLDFAGNTNYIVLSNFVLNPKLNNSLFSFTPPKGIDVEDQSKLDSIMMN